MSDGARLEAQGQLEKALAAYVGHRDWESAVRLALHLNRQLDAARYCLEAQRPYDAAVCFQRAGQHKECFEALLKVAAHTPRYRSACVHAVRVAQLIHVPLENHATYFMAFISAAPASPAEAEAMKALAERFAASGRARIASSVLRTVQAAYPHDAEVTERLAAIEKQSHTPQPFSSSASSIPGGLPVPSSATPAPVSSGSGLFRPPRLRLQDVLLKRGDVTQATLDKVTRAQPDTVKSDTALAEALVAMGAVKDETVLRALSESSGIGFLLDRELLDNLTPEAAKALPQEHAEKWKVVPVRLVERQLHVAMEDPRDVALVDRLRFTSGHKVVGFFATPTSIRRAQGKLYRGEEPSADEPSWMGQLYDPDAGVLQLEPFSDRYTGTREHQFETGEFEQAAVTAPKVAEPAPAPAQNKTPTRPKIGARFAGRYQMQSVIGEGGSAWVYRALDLELGEPVALKLFHPASEKEAESLIARFKLELSLSRQLNHENVIRLFDLGSEGEWRYLTMELLDGVDLTTRMEQAGGPLPLVEGLVGLEQAARGLQAAHEKGVVHRDVKPQNVFITRSGVVKVMDFGIARRVNAPGVTVVGTIAGTPEFMSPEQINGFSEVTHSTDLYALGVTAYQVFTGRLPFEYPALTRVLLAQATEQPPSPRVHNPKLPPALEALILQLLEKDVARRPATAALVASALRQLRESLG